MNKLFYILWSMRPNQWTKNFVLFAGLIFSEKFTSVAFTIKSLEAFAVFCLLSGVIYLLNDIADQEKDKLHDSKKNRPIASGVLRIRDAVIAIILLSIVGMYLAFIISTAFLLVAIVFYVLNVLYSFWLKRIVLLDVVSISISFILRAIAGVEALQGLDAGIELSPWLLVCTLFLSLLLAFCKRRHEIMTMDQASLHRHALAEYSPGLIDQLVGISAAGSILSYSIYTIWPETVEKFGTTDLVYTIPLVLIGVMRYLYLVYSKDKGGSPSELLLHEKFLLIDVFIWILLVIAILYLI